MIRTRLLLLGLLWASACAKRLPPTMVPDAIHTYKTDDGWFNDLRRYRADGPPVLLVHGMAVNHTNWDYRPEVSLAGHLQAMGYDVWVATLRGEPGARPPQGQARKADWSFDDYAEHDVPAMVDRVLELTGHDQLYWVGHSMGGILLYTAMGARPDALAAGVAIASPATFDHPLGLHHRVEGLRWAVKGKGRLPGPKTAGFLLRLGIRRPLEKITATPGSIDRDIFDGMARYTLERLPRPVAHEALGWLRAREVQSLDGEPWVRPSPLPLLVLSSPLDGLVGEGNVRAACVGEQAPFPHCTHVRLGTAQGFSHDYGHIDPLVGRDAPTEVWPLVVDFLAAQVAARQAEDEAMADAAPGEGGPLAVPVGAER